MCILSFVGVKMLHAHNPLSAMYYLEMKDNLDILNISLSQTGFQEALNKHYPNIEFDKVSNLEYKQLAVAYIKENFNLNINGNQVYLLKGGLKLGNHQTDFKFVTAKLPEQFNTLTVKINAFKENEHHQTIFSWSLQGISDKVILTEHNGYSATVEFRNNKVITDKGKFNTHYLWFIAIVPIFLVGRKILPSNAKRGDSKTP